PFSARVELGTHPLRPQQRSRHHPAERRGRFRAVSREGAAPPAATGLYSRTADREGVRMSAATSDELGLELASRLRLACEAHEPDIATHLERVSHYSCLLARLYGLPDQQGRLLQLASPLLDFGMAVSPE